MSASMIAVAIGGTRFTTPVEHGQEVTLGHGADCDLHLPPGLDVPATTVRLDEAGLHLDVGGQHVSGLPDDGPVRLDVDGVRFEAVAGRSGRTVVFDLRGRTGFVVGPWPGASVRVADGIELSGARGPDGRWVVSVPQAGLYLNNARRPAGRYVLDEGDHLGFGTADLVVLGDELHVDEAAVLGADLPRLARSVRTRPAGYPDHRRSPRVVHRPPEEKITLAKAPSPEEKGGMGGLAKLVLPPLAMIAVTVLMAFMRQNLLLVLGTGATTVVTLAFTVTGYRKDRRDKAAERLAVEAEFREHLAQRTAMIHAANEQQRSGALYHYPDIATLQDLALACSPRIFEKTPLHFDFLCYRLGLGTVATSSRIEWAGSGETSASELDLLARQVHGDALRLDGMSVTVDLRHGPVGYVGPRRLVIEQLQLVVSQLAVFHSYHDVQFVMVFGEDEHDDWSWMRWFRHSSLRSVNLRGFVHDQRSRDQVLSSLNQLLKSRRAALDEARGGQATTFSPHVVVVILDETLVLDHVVMELLRDDPTHLGCSVIVVQETMSSLSDSVTTVVDVRDRETGVLVLERGELRNTSFVLDHLPEGLDRELLPRSIGALEHRLNLTSSIPESVTFLEMYGVSRVEELGLAQRWSANSPHRTLGVPLGLRGPDDVVLLDLHEKAHGPHGLVAGTTGSGKSEIIQSYILSLAVNFHPHDVAFLLIDYKGGGMANLFSDLPHLLGTITNLDGTQSMRALVSINAELKRRQRVFSANDVNHINQYQKLYKSGAVDEPMPHLFLISDEFAELKSEQPEFMAELVSTARIGRSLGIHLILATQKPSGVVNDQIWSNSKFKLALKVADRSDSMEIIKTPDAAEITLPGRAYLQVGNNEIYELFQSAWSGADHRPDAEQSNQDDHTIYAIDDLGQYRVLNADLSGLDTADEVTQVPTELEAVVRAVRDEAADLEPLPRPWLPPLADRLHLGELHEVDPETSWSLPKSRLNPTIGRVDIPSRQTQETLDLELSGDGHLAVFGSPGYGKSTFLQTLVMDLARTHSPDHLHVYLLDLGTNGLLPLRGLPHVADTVTVEDGAKATKLAARLADEMKRRKRLLSGYAVANLEMFERASGQTLPQLLVVVDSFDGLKGSPVDEIVTGLVSAIAREGAGMGLHLAISAGRQASMRSALLGNIKIQLTLRLNDDSEARSIVGRTAVTIDDQPGRGLIRLEQPELFQTALPAAGADMLAVLDAVQAECAAMDRRWHGPRPEPIPVIPDRLTLDELLARPDAAKVQTAGAVPIGLDPETVSAVGLDLARLRRVLVLCRDAVAVGELLRTLWHATSRTVPGESFVLDADGTLDDPAGALGTQDEDLHQVLDAALAELTVRQNLPRGRPGIKRGAPAAPGLPPALVIIADASTVGAAVGHDRLDDLVRLLTDGPACGMPALIGMPLASVGKGLDPLAKLVKSSVSGIVRGSMSDQSVLTARNLGLKVPPPGEHEAFLVAEGIGTRVRLPDTPAAPELS